MKDDVQGDAYKGLGIQCSPRHVMPLNSINEGLQRAG